MENSRKHTRAQAQTDSSNKIKSLDEKSYHWKHTYKFFCVELRRGTAKETISVTLWWLLFHTRANRSQQS